jgi:hypothetical protein
MVPVEPEEHGGRTVTHAIAYGRMSDWIDVCDLWRVVCIAGLWADNAVRKSGSIPRVNLW